MFHVVTDHVLTVYALTVCFVTENVLTVCVVTENVNLNHVVRGYPSHLVSHKLS